MRTTGLTPVTAALTEILRCVACGATSFAAAPDAFTCRACAARVEIRGGVPHVRAADEDAAVTRERDAVRQLEEAPLLRPTDFSLASLLAGDGGLVEAFAALPYDDGSAFFRDNEYFQNVSRFAAVFDYVTARLGASSGGWLLDVGADLTWSTARLAARGWRAVGIDINDHLRAAGVLRQRGPDFAVVNMDMHLAAFRDEAFDAITAFNALHHTHRIETLIATLAAALKPGGRMCVVEPYWYVDAVREAFGASQIEAGINENVYRLEEWHRWFVQAGLELETFMISHSFNAVYVKNPAGTPPRALSLVQAEHELFDRFYRASLAGPAALPGHVPAGACVEVPIQVSNLSPAGWSSEGQLPVCVSHHLYRRTADGRTLVAFETGRSRLGEYLPPGATCEVRRPIAMPTEPGDYEADIDLVHEMRSWFADRGGTPLRVGFRVSAP